MIEVVTHKNLSDVLPLVKAYQQFYQNDNISEARNRAFFSRFCDDNLRGCQFLYRETGEVAGFVTLYFTFSSQLADDVTVLNDLYVLPEYRGRGIAKTLIEHSYQVSRERNTARLQWVTSESNKIAQLLYNRVAKHSGTWMLYTKTH
ncbi:ribosomal protein S18 acetylase RimI-like enzyme [Alteromonadaceae bacterium 2753L.S.0a.02]|nr:ribosomal protein S18 acetylase RimI-like enzyme [Alteromonadaceae bacterium 2753L.S.0a.02]